MQPKRDNSHWGTRKQSQAYALLETKTSVLKDTSNEQFRIFMVYRLRREITKALRSKFTKTSLIVLIGIVSVFVVSPFITGTSTTAAISDEYRTIDGSGNNLANPDYGKTLTKLTRLAPIAYEDGISTPRGGISSTLPNPRNISNSIVKQEEGEDIPNPQNVASMLMQWGQFLDHDIDLTEAVRGANEEPFPIDIPNDPNDQFSGQQIALFRSIFDPNTGTSVDNPREQENEITTWIDASNVYGSDTVRAQFLREGTCGRLKKSKNFELLPLNTEGLPNAPSNDTNLPIAGDIRANEQVGLLAMHTLFVREHNRLADIKCKKDKKDPSVDDEKIYQEVRKQVGAEMQAITYNEFLPILLGPNALPAYTGYDSTVNPAIANEFSTAAFRFGHTMLPPQMSRLKSNGTDIPEGSLSLRNAFFKAADELNPSKGKGIEPIMRGLSLQVAQKIDNKLVPGVRQFLFGSSPAEGGADLAALNIQRGREHGLPGYNAVRVALGLPAKTSFSEISSDPVVNAKFASVYSSPDDIDLWVAGLAEDAFNGGLVGETFHRIILDQFTRLRDGDHFWYKNPGVFSSEKLNEIENTKLADIIALNTKIKRNELSPEGAFIAAGQ